MASSAEVGRRRRDDLEEGEIYDDEDDDIMCVYDFGPRFGTQRNGRYSKSGTSRSTAKSRNIYNANSFSKSCSNSERNSRSTISRFVQLSGTNCSSVGSRKELECKYNRSPPPNYRKSSEKCKTRQSSGLSCASKSRASYRPRMSDYSYKRQRLLSSIRRRPIKRNSVSLPSVQEPSYEDLLEQYHEIKSQLRDLAQEESVIEFISSDESIQLEETDKENCKTQTDTYPPQSVSHDRNRQVRLHDSSNNSQSSKDKKASKSQTDNEVESEEEIEKLRKLALASTLQGKQSKHKKSNEKTDILQCCGVDKATSDASGDNYEEVAMELDSSSSSPSRIPNDHKSSRIFSDRFSSHTEINPEEDEDILRAIVLSSLTNKHLQKTTSTLDTQQSSKRPLSSPSTISGNNENTEVSVSQMSKCLVSVPPQSLISRPPIHQPVVINLNDDSDSEPDLQCFIPNKPSLDNIDDLLLKARQLSDTKANPDADHQVPLSIYDLPERDLLEYKRLKAEIAKRERTKAKQAKGFDAVNQDSGSDVAGFCDSPIPMSEYTSIILKLKSHEQNLSKQREFMVFKEAKLSEIHHEMNLKKSSLKVAEMKIVKLKEQLLSAVKMVELQKYKLEALRKMFENLQTEIQLQKKLVQKLEEDCLSTGKKVIGDSYMLPQTVTMLPNKRKLVLDNSRSGQKRKVVLSKSAKSLSVTIGKERKPKATSVSQEKAKLQKMEKEIAAKLEELRRRATKSAAVAKVNSEVPTKSVGGDAKPQKPVVEPSYQKRERRHSVRSKIVVKQSASSFTSAKEMSSLSKTLNADEKDRAVRNHSSADFKCTAQQYHSETLAQLPALDTQAPSVFSYDFHSMFLDEIPKLNIKIPLPESSCAAKHELLQDSFRPYRSPLLHLRSYRFSPYFRTKSNQCLSWSTYSHKLKSTRVLCRFDLTGTCNDDKCAWEHKKDYTMSSKEVLCDIVSYRPSLSGYSPGMTIRDCKQHIESYIDKLQTSNQDRMTQDELCVLLVGRVNESLAKVPPYYTTFEDRVWNPSQDLDDGGPNYTIALPKHSKKKYFSKYFVDEFDPEAVEDDGARYFDVDGQNGDSLESAVVREPHNAKLWLKLAYKKLNDVNCSPELGLDLALNAMSRGLEENQENSEMWLHYLTLYSKRDDCPDLIQLCEQAIKFAPKYETWWKYLQYSEGCNNKTRICIDALSFILQSSVEPEARSHQMLEILLYMCQLHILTDDIQRALRILEVALGRVNDDLLSQAYLLIDRMVSTDRCLTWLCYVHVLEFHTLPNSLFSPANSGLGKVVSKKFFILPWQAGHTMKLSINAILKLFMEALKNCVNKGQCASLNAQVCLPLYKNLIALQLFRGRKSSAINICEQLMKKVVLDEVWILLACVYFQVGSVRDVRKTLKVALKGCDATPRLFCFAAMFELSQGNVEGAKKWSAVGISSLYEFYEDDNVDVYDPEMLFRHALGFPLPLNCCIPNLKALTKETSQQKAYLWLNYCVFLMTQDRYIDVRECFEMAILRMTAKEDLEVVWSHFIQYSLCCVSESTSKRQDFLSLVSLIERCLTSVPCNISLPGSPSKCWTDYFFFNNVVDMYARALDSDQQIEVYERYFRMSPKNVSLAIKLLNLYLVRSEFQKAWYLCTTQLKDTPCCLPIWKAAIFLAQRDKSITKIRTLYSSATDALPYSYSLWKDYILFETANGEHDRVLQLKQKCEKIGFNFDIDSEEKSRSAPS